MLARYVAHLNLRELVYAQRGAGFGKTAPLTARESHMINIRITERLRRPLLTQAQKDWATLISILAIGAAFFFLLGYSTGRVS